MFSLPVEWVAAYAPISTWVSAMFTLGIMSILIKENPVYRACEHIFIGATSGYLVLTTFSNTIKPGVQVNMMTNGDYWEIIPICLGLLIYFQPFPSYRWISRIPVAFWIGYNAGLNITIRTFMPLMQNIVVSMYPLVVFNNGQFNPMASFTNIVFVISMLSTLFYFFFSFSQVSRAGGVLKVARWVMMIAFGASFGSMVMSRTSLFLGRAQFLLGDWLNILPK